MTKLTEEQIGEALSGLAGWEREGEAIVKTFQFEWFTPGMGFVTQVALLAERFDHHPDIDIRYTRVTMTLSTHSAGGITEKDLTLAEQIDQMVKR